MGLSDECPHGRRDEERDRVSDPRDPDSTLGDAGDEPFYDRIEAADEAD